MTILCLFLKWNAYINESMNLTFFVVKYLFSLDIVVLLFTRFILVLGFY